MAAINTALNEWLAGLDTGAGADAPTYAFALPVSGAVAGAVFVASLVVMTYLSIVAVRTFVAGEQRSVPRPFLTDRIPWVFANLLVGGIAYGLAVMVGTLLFVVPGIFLYVSFAFMTMYVAAENRNFVAALRESWTLTRGERLSVFLLVAVVLVVSLFVGMALGVLGVLAMVATGSNLLLDVLNVVAVAPLTLFNLAVLAAAYNQLRADDDGGAGAEPAATETPASPA